jgi:hypothetical protein
MLNAVSEVKMFPGFRKTLSTRLQRPTESILRRPRQSKEAQWRRGEHPFFWCSDLGPQSFVLCCMSHVGKRLSRVPSSVRDLCLQPISERGEVLET